MAEIRVPTLGESVTEATIGKWFKKPGEAVDMFSVGILRGRASTPADIVGVTTFLASEESDYITGQTIQVCGGKTLI